MVEKPKEEILKALLKNILESRLSRLEKRNLEQTRDLKLEKDSYKKQELLVNKLCSIKIEPKKLNQTKNNRERGARNRNRTRDITPNNLRTIHKRNNSNKKPAKTIRSMTPDVKLKRRGYEKKDKIKTDLRTTKKVVKKNNNNIPSYMMNTSSNANRFKKNDKNNNDKSRTKRRPRTTDIKKRSRPAEKKINKENNKNAIENNIKLIDLNIKDIKEHIPLEYNNEEIKLEKKEEIIQPKSEENREENKEEINTENKEEINTEEKEEVNDEYKGSVKFEVILEDKIIKTISLFLDKESYYNLLSCNKKMISYMKDKLSDSLSTLEIVNNISEKLSIKDQINTLKTKYPEEQFDLEPKKLTLSKSTEKALDLLNKGDNYKIFNDKDLFPPLDEIILIYRIFFQLLKDNDLKYIKNEKQFWLEASDYIVNKSDGKLGDYFRNSVDNFDFSPKNIFEIKKLTYQKEDHLKPANFSKICSTTGLISFLIKETLEYCGVLLSLKKNTPSICMHYLEYVEEAESKLTNYIENIRNWNADEDE